MIHAGKLCLIVTLTVLLVSSSAAITIKIGSVAPDRSPWDKGLEEMAREWARITDGVVRIKIYPGGIAGSESDMIRKMRVGVLGGAVLTNMGLTFINRDVYVLNVPLFIRTDGELRYILAEMKSSFESGVEDKGFKIVIWTVAGWVNIFSEHPVFYPQDLKKHKISFTVNQPEMEQAWKRSGFHVIPNELTDLMVALQSGMVNAFYLPPLVAASGQYFALSPNMCSLRIAPLLGGLVLTQKVWQRIPEEYHEPMMEVAHRISQQLIAETERLETEAIDTMKEHGLKVNDIPPDAMDDWIESAHKGLDALVGKAFSTAVYRKVDSLLKEYRQKSRDQ